MPWKTVRLESREACYTAVAWLLHKLNPDVHDAVAVMVNSRDPRTRRVVFMAAGSGTVECEGHVLRYDVESSAPVATDGKPETLRTLSMTGSLEAVHHVMETAVDEYRAFLAGPHETCAAGGREVPYWVWDSDTSAWRRGVSRPHRSLDTLYLTADAKQVVDDVRHFMDPANLARYRELHVAPTRIYMLHGKPGSGKTSTIHCLASDLGMGVATVDCCDNDMDLKAALNTVPAGCLLKFEDVDSLFEGRKPLGGITFGGLLDALDSLDRPGTGVFLTTNRLCALDPALRRRVDFVLDYGHATRDQCRRMVHRFFPHADFEAFWAGVRTRTFSMSVLQKYLVKCMQHAEGGDPLSALPHFEALVDMARAEDTEHCMFYT